jgi:hypothetical protein
MNFDRWLQRFVTRGEKILFRLTLAFVVLLFIVQAVFLEKDFRHFFSKTEQLEGEPLVEDTQEVFGKGDYDEVRRLGVPGEHHKMALVLQLVPPPEQEAELFLLLNNEVVSRLGDENLYLPVDPGDMLEIVGTVNGGNPAVVKVLEVIGGISAPAAGHEITTFGERELLAWIVP